MPFPKSTEKTEQANIRIRPSDKSYLQERFGNLANAIKQYKPIIERNAELERLLSSLAANGKTYPDPF
jgi:hypothetical protein